MPIHQPYSPEFLRDPYDTLAELRRCDPLPRVDLFGFVQAWLVTRYADGRRVLSDPDFQMSLPGERGPFEPPLEDLNAPATLANSGPQDHARLRRLMMQGFTHHRITALRPRIERIVAERVDAVAGAEEIDVVSEFARPVAVGVIGEILGVPEAERAGLPERILGSRESGLSADELRRRNQETMRRAHEYLAELVAEKRAHPAEDVTSALIAAYEGTDRLSEDELRYALMSLLIAGFVTSLSLVGSGIAELLDDTGQRKLLADSPELAGGAVEEACRFQSPFLSASRVAVRDCVIGEVPVRRGDVVVVSLNSVNRDEQRFTEPDTFDITRSPNPHLAFGHGAHHCLGAAVARLEAGIATESFLRRFPAAAPVEPERKWRSDGIIRSLAELRVRLSGVDG